MYVRRFVRGTGPTLVADIGGDSNDPTVVLLHGASENRHVWAALARSLVASGFQVVSIDLRGHGDSGYADDGDYTLEAFTADIQFVLATLDVPVVLVGRRIGGLIALMTAQAASNIAGAVLIDAGFGHAGNEHQQARAFMLSAAEGYANLDEAFAHIEINRPSLARKAMLRRLLRQGDDLRWRWRYDPSLMSGALDQRIDLVRDEPKFVDAARALPTPTLLVRTGSSVLLGPSDAERMTRHFKDVSFVDLTQLPGTHPDAALSDTLLDFLDKAVPRDGGRQVRKGIDPKSMRQALGCFATGVTIITATTPDGQPVGLTANSFSSVSLDPPLILFCIDRKVASLAVFEECNSFAVNILHAGQQDLSNLFVKKGVDRFADTGWETWEAAAPIIQDAMASFECEKYQVFDGGDHRIFIGRVREIWCDPARDPLLFFQGTYRRVHAAT